MKLNLGCGPHALPGFVNLDVYQFPGVTTVHDLNNYPYPFADNSFDEIFASHILEHLDDFVGAMKELHRIAKPGAKIKIKAPYFSGPGAYRVSHKHFFFHLETFNYFTKKHYSKTPFSVQKTKIFFFSAPKFMNSNFCGLIDWFINLKPILYQRFLAYVFPAAEIHYVLTVVKED